MKLALRADAPGGATWSQKLACNLIKARLVSQFSHGGMVIDGGMYHMTASRNMHIIPEGQWEPDKWHLFELGTARDAEAKRLFEQYKAAKYDWVSLLAFVGPRVRDASRIYCFEWCWLAMAGENPSVRIMPEKLIELAWRMTRCAT